MVQFITPWEIVNGMWSARERGHGWVSTYLRQVGVPRSTAYRYDKQLCWLVESGAAELRRLRAENARLTAAAARRGEERAAEAAAEAKASRVRERALILEAAMVGTSDTEAARLLWRALGRSVSHETVHAVIAAAAERAPAVFRRHFAGVGQVGAADEIFLGRAPLLLVVGPRSLAIGGLRLAAECTAEDWKPVFAAMKDLRTCVCDGGSGLNAAAKKRELDIHGDLFHGERKAEEWLGRFRESAERRLAAEAEARAALEAAGVHPADALVRRAERAAAEADRVLGEWCRLSDLWAEARRAFDLVTPEGRPNTPALAQAAFRRAVGAIERTPEGLALGSKLKALRDPRFFAHLGTLEEALSGLCLERVGPDRPRRLGRLVAQTLAWRRRDKDPVDVLRAASTGSLADALELAVIEAVDLAVRSSSAVECVNSRIRLVQVARKRLGEKFLYLLAIYHNMHQFGRGSVRAGKTPAELAGIELPTSDWIELLDLPVDDVPGVIGSKEAPAVAAPAAASGNIAA